MTQNAEPTAERWTAFSLENGYDILDASGEFVAHFTSAPRCLLAAAAPEMRDLLKRVVEMDDWQIKMESKGTIIGAEARALLAKIEGEG